MKRVLVDLTDLESWDGVHGGIQRVVYGISKELFANRVPEVQIKFMHFSEARGGYCYSSFEPIFAKVEGYAYVKSNALGLGKIINRARAATGSGFKKQDQVRSKEVKFNSSDTILVLGMSWSNPNIQPALGRIRLESGARIFQMVYDLIIPLYPHLHHQDNVEPYTNNMIGVINNSDGLLAISNSTANDLKSFAKDRGLVCPSTKVIRLGDEKVNLLPEKPALKEVDLAEKFILCVGTVEIRKNHSLLYYAYKLAAEKEIKLPGLVIVGGGGWYSGDIQYLIKNDASVTGKIEIVHNLSDRGLAWLYQNCLFTVYPSMYEGWGLPIAESMAYGKACAASQSSSMPEIGKDLVSYFSPYSSDQLLLAIQKLCKTKTRVAAEKRIAADYKVTTWGETTRQLTNSLLL